jgi:serine/threonine-protein kinase
MGSLPTEHAVDIAIAVCEALENAHALGIVHADLDPTMVRLDWTSDGPSNVKVSGLGTSRALLVADGELDARVDVWAIGVLLYTMLAGASPFGGDTPSTSDVSTAGDEPALLAGVPDGLAEIVDACLARHPARRPQSASSVAALLAVFGTRPIFEKRSSLLVVDTGPYEALVLEELVKEAAPSTRQLAETAATPPSPDKTPVPVVVTRSVPPVAVTLAPPPPSPARQWRTTALVAAACIGLGVFAGAFAMHRASSTPSSSVSAAAVHTPPPPAAEPLPEPVAKAAMPASPAVQPATLSVSDLPAMPTSKARPRSPAAKSGVAPAAPVDPIVHSASAPMQPQPKADDDLRRFLDDRR